MKKVNISEEDIIFLKTFIPDVESLLYSFEELQDRISDEINFSFDKDYEATDETYKLEAIYDRVYYNN